MLADDLVRVFGARRVLDRVSLTAAPGHRIGLIGENGAGKSTLLGVLAGNVRPAGELLRRRDLRIGLLAQDTTFDRPDRKVRPAYDLAFGAARQVVGWPYRWIPLGCWTSGISTRRSGTSRRVSVAGSH